MKHPLCVAGLFWNADTPKIANRADGHTNRKAFDVRAVTACRGKNFRVALGYLKKSLR